MKQLDCNPGNYQCGGKCQTVDYNCQIGQHKPSVNKALSSAARQAALKYQKGKLLGEGAYGRVYESLDGIHVIKEAKDEKHDFSNEIAYYNKAHSIGIAPKAEPGLQSNQMILTKVKGKSLKDTKSLTESDVKSILQTRQKLHEAGIVHNDLHYENVMKDEITGRWNIIDFGSAGPINAADLITELTDTSDFFGGKIFEANPNSELAQRYNKMEPMLENLVRRRGNGSMREGYRSFTEKEVKGILRKYYQMLWNEAN